MTGPMQTLKRMVCMAAFVATAACSGGDAPETAAAADAASGAGVGGERALLIAHCEADGGEFNRREYGEQYCECWADTARNQLSGEAYSTLVGAVREMATADRSKHDAIAFRVLGIDILSEVEQVGRACQP